MATVTELVTKFAFDGALDPLMSYNKELGGAIKLLGGFAAATITAAAAGVAWVTYVLTGIDKLNDLSIETGVAVDQIQMMGYAAQVTGSSADSLNSSLRGLSNNIGLAIHDMGRGKEIFKELGIQLKDTNGHAKNTAVVLDEVRQKMNKLNLSNAERRGFASRLGIDESLVQYLSQTDAQMNKLLATAKALGTVTAEQANDAADYNDSLDTMRYALSAIHQQIAVGLAPTLKELADSFTALLVENKGWIIDGIKAAVELIGQLIAMIVRLTPVLVALGLAFAAARIYALGFAGVMAIIGSPVVLITAAIVGLVLIVDDLIVAFKGGNSVIGNFFKGVLGIDLSKTFEQLQKLWEWIVKITQAIAGRVGRIFGGGSTTIEVKGTLPPSVAEGGGKGTIASGGTDNRKVEQNVTMNISTNDPVQAGRAAADGVGQQLKDANNQLGTGGR